MGFIVQFLSTILAFTNWVWGYPMLILLVGGGLYLAVRLRFIPFRKLPFILKSTIGKSLKREAAEHGKFSAWQAAAGSLASTLGAGSIVGTAMAIAFGGPGGVFWLWVAGLVACAIKFCEVTLCMIHRHKDEDGNWVGGPQYYLSDATKIRGLGIAYAIVCMYTQLLAASAQIGSGVDNLVVLGAPRLVCTIILTLLCAVVVIGGMTRLLHFSEKVVPIMSVLYMTGTLIVILLNIGNLPEAIASIFRYAFTGRAAFGGFAGATVIACIRWGICRGVYSNDAGSGSTTMTHAMAEVNHPVQQGMWGVFEAFFTTLIVCSMTCFAILCSGVWTQEGVSAASMTSVAFGSVLGFAGQVLVAISVLLFTFTTAVAQLNFSAECLGRFFGENGKKFGRFILLVLIFVGGIVGIEALINYVDFGSFLQICINMTGVLYAAGQIVPVVNEYFADPKRWESEKWSKWVELENQTNQGAKE